MLDDKSYISESTLEQRYSARKAVTVCLAEIRPEPIHWLWPGRIALGKVTLIAGDPGLGKSLVTIAMAAHVSTGREWPVDGTPCPAGDVVIISAEDDLADTIRPRLDAAGADPSRIHCIKAIREFDTETDQVTARSLSLRKDLAHIDAELDALPNCRLLIIDPISAYLDGTDSHNNADVRGLLAPLADLASKHQVAVIAVTHLNKGGSSSPLYRAMGSLAFVAAARAVFGVAKDEENPARRLMMPLKSNLGPDTSGVAYEVISNDSGLPTLRWDPCPITEDLEDVFNASSGGERSDIQDAADWLKDVLAPGRVKTKDLQSLASHAGHAWRTVKRAKSKLGVQSEKTGYGADGVWFWSLPSGPKDAKESKDDQPAEVAHFDQVGHLNGGKGKQRSLREIVAAACKGSYAEVNEVIDAIRLAGDEREILDNPALIEYYVYRSATS